MSRQAILQKVIEKTREIFPQVERLLLFGSQARGDAREDSDYDLLVVTPLPEGARNRAVPLYLALWGLGASFDIIVKTPAEFAEFCASDGYWQRTIVQESMVLHEAA